MAMTAKPILHLVGGYGEHGRSCFLLERLNGRYIMVDCGILDTDCKPYPKVSHSVLTKTDYLFLTHCHKDHTGAFQHFVSCGFSGTVFTEELTAMICKLAYSRFHLVQCTEKTTLELDDITVTYGRSGHCIGSLWFHLEVDGGTYFFSGDYQDDTLVYAVDKAENLRADEAVVDCGHEDVMHSAALCRDRLVEQVRDWMGQPLVMPVQLFGRGLEVLYLLKTQHPQAVISVDDTLLQSSRLSLAYGRCFKDGVVEVLEKALVQTEDFQIFLTADTHLERTDTARYVNMGCHFISTGRVKPDGAIDKLLSNGMACHLPYCHHQSEADLQKTIKQNQFAKTYPFHGHTRRIIITEILR